MLKRRYGTLCVLMSAIFFSLGGLLIKRMTWSAFTINGVRSVFSVAMMLLYMRLTHHRLRWNRLVVLGAICSLLMNLTFVLSTKMTSAANAIVLEFTAPVWLILFLWLFLEQRPHRTELITCGVVLAGIVCFFFGQLTPSGLWGNLLAILSGATYAVIFMLKSIEGADYESSTVFGQTLSILVSIPFWFTETDFTANNLVCVSVLGIVQMGAAFILLGIGLNSVHPVTASLLSTIEPILNPVWVALFWGETIGIPSLIGAAIVLTAVTGYNVLLARRKRTPVPR